MNDNLFIGVFPGGISYCDRSIEVAGDYKQVAFLPYDTLELAIRSPRSKLLPIVREHAATIQARKGEQFSISGNQTVKLGTK